MYFDMPTCGGCRTCEAICSFKHTGEFAPSFSSLKIVDKKEGHGYRVLLAEEDNPPVPACDGCRGLEEPLCVQYCREGDELRKMIDEFIQKVGDRPKSREGSTL